MNRAFGVSDYDQGGVRDRRARAARQRRLPGARSSLAVFLALTISVVVGLLLPLTAAGNPHHSADDYFMFAKALATGVTTDRKAFEPVCDSSQHKQADIPGSNSFFHGRIHSNADIEISGSNHQFVNTVSPNPEITFGTHPGTCQMVAQASNSYASGGPTNIDTLAHQVDATNGWPGNLGSFLTAPAYQTFGTDITQVLGPGAVCNRGSLANGSGTTITIASSDHNTVVCNGTGPVNFSSTLNVPNPPGPAVPSSAANPFRITIVSHGLISFGASNMFLAPATSGHGILAWTDQPFSANATSIQISGSQINVRERAILFTPRSGQFVAGSNQATMCLQMIGQGSVIANGSNTTFGPLAPNCGSPASVVTEIHANRQGDQHFNLGAGASAVEVGTTVHDKVVVASTKSPQTNLAGTITLKRFSNGTCTPNGETTATWTANGGPPAETGGTYAQATSVTIDPALGFTPAAAGVFSYRASYGGDANGNLANAGSCEGPLRVVDARITINPPTGVNAVGTQHALTGHVDINPGTGFVAAPAGTVITFAVVAGTGTVPASCTTINATGSCTVNLTNTAAGMDTVSASTTVDVLGVALTRSTAGNAGPGGSVNATKTWVDLRISLAPLAATNSVDNPNHQITALVEKNEGLGGGWVPVSGATVTFALLNNNAGATFVGPGSCGPTDAAGECSVTITSSSPGSVDVQGSTTVTVSSQSITRTTGTPQNTNAGGSGNASKTWVDLRISVTPLTDTNKVSDPHAITALVEQNAGTGWAPVNNATVTFTLLAPNTANATFVGGVNSCTTGPPADAGKCTVSINTSTPGSVDIQASTTVTVGVHSITRTTGTAPNPSKFADPATGGNANKIYVDLRISLTPEDATNPLSDPDHEITALVQKNEGLGGGWVAVDGATVNFALLNNTIGADFEPAGANSCTTAANGMCSITITSTSPGSVDVQGSTTVTVSGLSITRTTGTDANTNAGGSGNASKSWVGGGTFLIIDEDSIDNGICFFEDPVPGVQNICDPVRQFTDEEVNDDKADIGMRDVLRYFAANEDRTISLLTGQTGDEGWFAPNCIPLNWISGTSTDCATDEAGITQGIANFIAGTVEQDQLDKIPDVRPLRALGLVGKIDETICAVVFDSDISINYDHGTPLGVNGNLQGATLGIVAFTVLDVVKLEGFSDSSLPEVQIKILDAETNCAPTELNDAPIPESSSEPEDIDPANPPATGYRNRP